MSESELLKTVKTANGQEHKVAFEMNVNGRRFIVTIDRKVLSEDETGSISECSKDDETAKVFYDSLKPSISLDVDPER